MYFADLERKDNELHTSLPVKIGTSFFLDVTFSGTYSEGCGFEFYIKDTEIIYLVDFRLNYKGLFKTLLQSYQLINWGPDSIENVALKAGTNSIEVKVGSDFFRVWVNGAKFREAVGVDLNRLINYSYFVVGQYGTCASVNFQTSYVDFSSKCTVSKTSNCHINQYGKYLMSFSPKN